MDQLFEAIYNNNVDRFVSLIESNVLSQYESPWTMLYEDSTLVHETITWRNARMLDYVLSKTNQVNHFNLLHETPLHVAIHVNNLYAVQRLLEMGVDTTLEDEHGYTAVHIAAEKNDIHLLMMLESFQVPLDRPNRNDSLGPFTNACKVGKIETASYILSRCGLEQVKQNNPFAIHWAAYNDQLETVEWLLTLGYEPDTPSLYGNTAIHDCAEWGRLQLVETMLPRVRQVSIQNRRS